MTSWRIILQEPGAVVAHVDGLLLQIWQGPAPTAEKYDVIPPVLDDDARRHGRKPACLVIVAPSSQLPDRDARQKGATLPHHISAYVGVHEGSDFRSSLLRMVIASIAMMAREEMPSQIVGTLDAGCTALWPSLAPSLQQQFKDAAGLATAIGALRATIAPWSPGAEAAARRRSG